MITTSRLRRLAAGAGAAIALHAALLSAVSADLLPGSSQRAAASPSPTPCSVPAPLCGLGGPGPSPTPSPAASASPSPSAGRPSPTPTASPQGGAAAAPASPSPSASATPSPGASPSPAAAAAASPALLAEAAAHFKNAPFLGSLLDILSHPSGAEHPDLRHFRPLGDPAPAAAAGPGATLPPGSSPAAVAAAAGGSHGVVLPLLLGLLTAALAGVAAVRPRERRRLAGYARARISGTGLARRRLSRGPAMVAIGLAALPVVGGLALVGATRSTPPPRAEVARSAAGHSAVPVVVATRADPGLVSPANLEGIGAPAPAPAAPPPAWESLVAIERGLSAQQDQLAGQEAAIRRITAILSLPTGDPDLLPATIAVYAERTNALAQLVAAHTATQAAYQQSLQAEYDLYRTAAQNPPVREQLVAAAAAAPVPEARDAVTYDISTVQTQLAQEQAIATAEARLQQMGALGGAQLDAIKHHQPFIVPELAAVTQPFGPTDFSLEPPLSYHGTFFPHFHTGLDLAGPLGMPVHAAADGVVLLATASLDSTGKLVGYGNYVVIAHPDGFVSLYGHLDALSVKAGDVVRQGQIIGFEGSTGWSTGPHLHFEIRHNGDFLDPAPYLAGQLPG